jgi:hypothetical protein
MLRRTLTRLSSAADLLRPQTFFRTLARVDQLVDTTRELTTAIEALRVRTEQLAAIERLNWEQQEDLARLPKQLDRDRISAHVHAAVAAAPLCDEPFPHVVVNEWLPPDVYDIVIDGLPPSVFFADREVRRQRLLVPFSFAPAYARHVWHFVAEEIVGALNEALSRKFEGAVREYVGQFCPRWFDEPRRPLHPSDGRIMLRRAGYLIEPHRDPRWGFLTGLVYLARPGDLEVYGTDLYRVRDDVEASDDKPLRFAPERCELVKSVPFRANTLFAFLNSRGAHGASVPADAPASLERYVYQFRLGPDPTAMKQLLSLMPPAQRARWSGGKTQRESRSASTTGSDPYGVDPAARA